MPSFDIFEQYKLKDNGTALAEFSTPIKYLFMDTYGVEYMVKNFCCHFMGYYFRLAARNS